MNFSLSKSFEILERTPRVLETFLNGLSEEWIFNNEGGESWSPFDIIGHLIHGEKTDWIARTEIILSDKSDKTFLPFDRFAQFEASQGKTISQLLDEFQDLRNKNLASLKSKNISESDLKKTGIHPAFGTVTLENLLACWVAHDLGHIAQISRVMAKQYKEEVGPWQEYLPILDR
ncbi:MAG TPA: DinB family protein [Flavobacterium sp.]|uniref:DinB family protein n=1 Tax=Flavobacterium sp. TaxID=239 RepID=UPI002C9BBDBD|nr:DinB family protein [Flavobacterium sp.]HNP31915.1 DinB family protein [Flavobacterium sp.]